MHREILTAIAKDDYEMEPHTWGKGLDYQLVDRGDFFTLASNEGQTNITANNKYKIAELFDIQHRQ